MTVGEVYNAIKIVTELEIIRRYFSPPNRQDNVILGIGDDAAIVSAGGKNLAVCTDSLVAGTHFFEDANPHFLGRKSLAVSVSDLAAMGAIPLWATIAITLKKADSAWLKNFAQGIKKFSQAFDFAIIGGDTTRGNCISITTSVIGMVGEKFMIRGGASAGDSLWVSGEIGDAALALWAIRNRKIKKFPAAKSRLENPIPRIKLGRELSPSATAAIDLSDGILAGIKSLGEASGVGAEIDADSLPQSDEIKAADDSLRLDFLLGGGDDYELLFTASPQKTAEIQAASAASKTKVTRIGEMTKRRGIRVFQGGGAISPKNLPTEFRHFQ